MTRGGLTAAARLCVGPGAGPGRGRQRIRWSQSWPVVMRPTGDDRVHLVHGAGGPLGGDAFALEIGVAPDARLRVRSAGATLVQPGGGGSARWDVAAEVGSGGRLDWAPEPTVVCDAAGLRSSLRVDLAAGAGAVLREIVVLGRHGESGGRYRGEVSVDVDGAPLLAHTTILDGADPALCGPAGTAGERAVGMLVLAGAAATGPLPGGAGDGPGLRWVWTELDGPGRVLMAVGDVAGVTALLEERADRCPMSISWA